jgi:hypothetical protein
MAFEHSTGEEDLGNGIRINYGTVIGTSAAEWGNVMLSVNGLDSDKQTHQLLEILAARLQGDAPVIDPAFEAPGLMSSKVGEKIHVPAPDDEAKKKVMGDVSIAAKGLAEDVKRAGGVSAFLKTQRKQGAAAVR